MKTKAAALPVILVLLTVSTRAEEGEVRCAAEDWTIGPRRFRLAAQSDAAADEFQQHV